jgi:regulator of sigma E protease
VTTSILAFVFVLGVLIFVHEFGHFIMARRIGVRVLTFSLGFGPKLFAFKRGDTEYCVSAIPLGGYVKMAGETQEDARTGASDEFLSKSKWQRFQVLVMGPVMNLLLAIVVMAFVLYQGAQVPAFDGEPPIVGSFTEQSAARKAGVLIGDRIVAVDGRDVDTWEQFLMAVLAKPKREISLTIVRQGTPATVLVVPDSVGKFEMGEIGVLPVMHPVVGGVEAGSAAAEAGLKPGDVVMAAAGERDVTINRFIEIVKTQLGKPLVLDIKRDGAMQRIEVTPRQMGDTVRIGVGPILPYETRMIEPGPIEALQLSVQRNWEWSTLIVRTLGGLVTRETSVKQLMGPVAIAQVSGTAAEAGWIQLFSLMAMLSLNLGLLNLMPIPVLDGGHIAILAMEGLSRRDFSIKVKEKMLLVGFVLLLMLMVTVIYNDLTRVQWVERLMPWR